MSLEFRSVSQKMQVKGRFAGMKTVGIKNNAKLRVRTEESYKNDG